MSNEVTYTVTGRKHNHPYPWFDEDKTYVTEIWEYASFDMEDAVIQEAVSKGWDIYLVGDNRPAIVVYKKVTE
jgi:hypothetical protein